MPHRIATACTVLFLALLLSFPALAADQVDVRRGGSHWARIEKGGAGGIRRDGSPWGSASPCCSSFDESRRLAALLYFFEPGFFRR